MVNNMIFSVKLINLVKFILDSLITTMAQSALKVLLNVDIDDFEKLVIHIKNKIFLQKLAI